MLGRLSNTEVNQLVNDMQSGDRAKARAAEKKLRKHAKKGAKQRAQITPHADSIHGYWQGVYDSDPYLDLMLMHFMISMDSYPDVNGGFSDVYDHWNESDFSTIPEGNEANALYLEYSKESPELFDGKVEPYAYEPVVSESEPSVSAPSSDSSSYDDSTIEIEPTKTPSTGFEPSDSGSSGGGCSSGDPGCSSGGCSGD